MLDSNLDKALRPVALEGGLMGSPEAGPAARRKRGILVVDDDADVRAVLGVGLRQEGFATWLAANGLEALDLYWHNSRTIDVVLLDVRMPGLDGPQTLATLRDLNPRLLCCFISGDFGGYSGGGTAGPGRRRSPQAIPPGRNRPRGSTSGGHGGGRLLPCVDLSR